MKLIKGEDIIGTYYSINIKPDIILETCGTSTEIIDQKNDDDIISNIDSMIVVDNAVYGISNKKYFLLTLPNLKVVYSSTPIAQYSNSKLLSPKDYYDDKTKYIDLAGFIVLLCCIIFVIKIGIFK